MKMFAPSPGTLSALSLRMENTRLDAGYAAGNTVTPFYDPMIAKLVVWDDDRPSCIERALKALERLELAGTKPNGQPMAFNVDLHRHLLSSEEFRTGNVDTRFLERLARSLR